MKTRCTNNTPSHPAKFSLYNYNWVGSHFPSKHNAYFPKGMKELSDICVSKIFSKKSIS